MKLEAVNSTQIETVLSMIRARTHLIDNYLAGNLSGDDENVDETAIMAEAAGAGAAGENKQLEFDGKQELFEKHMKRAIDKTLKILHPESEEEHENEDEVERLREHKRERDQPFTELGPPGSGKTTRAKKLIRYVKAQGGDVLFTFPTGQMQSRLRAELQKEGLQVDVDTCHGAFALHKKEHDALPVVDSYTLIIVDDFPQLSKNNFERIIRLWDNTGRLPVLLFLGDFHQLPGIEGTNAKDSNYWKRLAKFRFDKCWRADDDVLLRKLGKLQKAVPKRRDRNQILRGHKACSHDGPPTEHDLRQLCRCTGGKTTIVTCTRRAARMVNDIAANVLVGKRRLLVDLPGDREANPDNFTVKGQLNDDRRPVPSRVEIRKGLQLHLTKNLDKEGDFVNGMECVVKSWDESSRCLRAETVTGKTLAIFQYTDPNPAAQNASYASTIYKMQGAELPHITIWLDVPGQRAAAYVAMSRVSDDACYLFGGKLTRKHFVPNA